MTEPLSMTTVAGVPEGTRIVDEERSGPALPVLRHREIDEVVERANATHFGLSGSIRFRDLERDADVASRLERATASVNQHFVILPFTPCGGAKGSGIGVENGPWGRLGFTELLKLNARKALRGDA